MAKYLKYILCALLCLLFISCESRNIRHNVRGLPKGAAIAVILNASEGYIERANTLFTISGYSVRAISIFKDEDAGSSKHSAGLFRLDVYNSEITKAANLRNVKSNLKADYLIILELGMAKMNWARAIDLRTNEIICMSNYSPGLGENIETVINYFILSMTGE